MDYNTGISRSFNKASHSTTTSPMEEEKKSNKLEMEKLTTDSECQTTPPPNERPLKGLHEKLQALQNKRKDVLGDDNDNDNDLNDLNNDNNNKDEDKDINTIDENIAIGNGTAEEDDTYSTCTSSSDDLFPESDPIWYAFKNDKTNARRVTNEELIERFRGITSRLKTFVTPRTSIELDKQRERFERVLNSMYKSNEEEQSPRDNEISILQIIETLASSDDDDDDDDDNDDNNDKGNNNDNNTAEKDQTPFNTEERVLKLNMELSEWDGYYYRMSDETKKRFCALKAKLHAITAILNIQKASEMQLNNASNNNSESSDENTEKLESQILVLPSTSKAMFENIQNAEFLENMEKMGNGDNTELMEYIDNMDATRSNESESENDNSSVIIDTIESGGGGVHGVDSAYIVRIFEKMKKRLHFTTILNDEVKHDDGNDDDDDDDDSDSDYKSIKSYNSDNDIYTDSDSDNDSDWKSCYDFAISRKTFSDFPLFTGCACMLHIYRRIVEESVNKNKTTFGSI